MIVTIFRYSDIYNTHHLVWTQQLLISGLKIQLRLSLTYQIRESVINVAIFVGDLKFLFFRWACKSFS